MKTQRVTFILLSSLIAMSNLPSALCAPATGVHKHRTAAQSALAPKSDVIVTKNADGTVEVSDASSGATADSSATIYSQRGGVTYKPAPEATIRYADGVVVHRHADGSCEVEDADADQPVFHSFASTSAPVHNTQTHHQAYRSASKHIAMHSQ